MLKTFKKLRKEAPRKFKDLRAICDDMIGESLHVSISPECAQILSPLFLFILCHLENQLEGASAGDINADKFVGPLQMACETRYPKLMEISLVAFHFLLGKSYVLPLVSKLYE